MKTIKILIANRYFLMNYAIRCILQRIKGFDVYGVSENEILDEIIRLKPDILVIEIEMIRGDSLELIAEIKKNFKNLKIIVLLDTENHDKLINVLELQLNGYLMKNISREELIHAATCVHQGERYFSREINQFVMENVFGSNGNSNDKNSKDILSEREKEILRLIVSGRNNREIAEKLFISQNTVLTHRRNIMKKLEVKNTAQLITTSVKQGLITLKY
jgi:DNA-binding NarL/FixJ family response regulator